MTSGLFVGTSAAAQPPDEELLRPRRSLGASLDRSASLSFGDVDGDGDLDIVVANGRHWAQRNEIFLNNGKGFFGLSRRLGDEGATSLRGPAGRSRR